MAADSTRDGAASDAPAVARYRTAPGESVFAEDGNADAWIATDYVVELEE